MGGSVPVVRLFLVERTFAECLAAFHKLFDCRTVVAEHLIPGWKVVLHQEAIKLRGAASDLSAVFCTVVGGVIYQQTSTVLIAAAHLREETYATGLLFIWAGTGRIMQ
jgi:hypothetical protein